MHVYIYIYFYVHIIIYTMSATFSHCAQKYSQSNIPSIYCTYIYICVYEMQKKRGLVVFSRKTLNTNFPNKIHKHIRTIFFHDERPWSIRHLVRIHSPRTQVSFFLSIHSHKFFAGRLSARRRAGPSSKISVRINAA